MRVARVDRHAVHVLPLDARWSGMAPDGVPDAGPDGVPGVTSGAPGAHAGDELLRVDLDRDGLVPAPDGGRVPPTVGDVVVVGERLDGAPHVTGLEPRRTAVVRDSAGGSSRTQVLAANVDLVLVAEHLDPDPDLGRVERLLTIAWTSGARPVVVLTKADLVPDPDGMAAEVALAAPGSDVHPVSATTGTGLDPLRALLTPGTTLVVLGPSGAGKSTLVNALAGADVVATGERRADGRGRHTTTRRELVRLPGGALLIDTPGLRAVGVVADDAALEATFADVAALAARCRFADCAHRTEPGCAVRAALETGELPERRYRSWLRLAREAAWQERRSNARLAALEKARWKQRTVEYHASTRGR
ncbi:putative ribosome biogenesis GTPase RsgA [Cellulomonas aerilata]|uniref:Small ribosomal subunit biogenesis GTPase RsgA n=2 Tax=Cellulomonas aerilata TaxID=515326 RepID=A0A512DF03_9CELL|nr:putative ribosome biogenesis GTPase RsgA [Cellulomonas aerilata]